MSKGDQIADYLRRHDTDERYLVWSEKLRGEGVDFTRVERYDDGLGCVVTRDERGYFVYGPYLTWKAGA